jgi:hypothetical protein
VSGLATRTGTRLPLVEKLMAAHRLPDITVAADVDMAFEAIENVLLCS